jgi:hypothetical protein
LFAMPQVLRLPYQRDFQGNGSICLPEYAKTAARRT